MTLQDFLGETVAVYLGSEPHIIRALEHTLSTAGSWLCAHVAVAWLAFVRALMRK